jgi:hypothetical protein
MNKFTNVMGNRLLKGLFFEETSSDKTGVLYTLKNRDHLGYPSLYRLYMETNDPTEYTFATQYLDGWEHWERLCECSWFKPYVEVWRRELEVRFRATALRNIVDASNDTKNPSAYQASKFLVGQGWKEGGPKRRAGQPSKDEIKKELHRQVQITKTLDDDFERITGKAN